MKLAVFGATGRTGIQVVRQACAAGHDVTAVVRDPARLPTDEPKLRVVRADLMDPAEIGPAVAGSDAVISAIGSRDGVGPTSVCADTATAIIAAMRGHGVARLIVVSSGAINIGETDGLLMRVVTGRILGRLLQHPFGDMRRMEELVSGSGLDWTIVRPPRLTNGRRTGDYRTTFEHNVPGGTRLSRADLADQLLRCLTDDRTIRSALAAAY